MRSESSGLIALQVVVPLIALRQDLRHRCHAVGIRCREWSSRSPPDDARVVLVTPESARSDDFVRFINRIRGQGRLDRIVIDECHVVLNPQRDFRPRLRELGELNHAAVPVVMLTATLPPSDEAEFHARMWMQGGECEMFRSATTRKNIRYRTYQVRERTSRAQEEELMGVINTIRGRLTGEEKMVVYSSRVDDCEALAQQIGCEAYFHDAQDKKGAFQRFARDSGVNIIVATSAFGMGIDVPHIRCVIHMNEARTLFDYSQESGRAGRDGLTSVAMMIRGRMKGSSPVEGLDPTQRALVERYMNAACQRVVLDAYLDGRQDRQGCEEGEDRCEGCEQRVSRDEEEETRVEESEKEVEVRVEEVEEEEFPIESDIGEAMVAASPVRMAVGRSIVARHQDGAREAQGKIGRLRYALDGMRGRCAYCYITRPRQGSEHAMYFCQEEGCQAIKERCREWKEGIRRRKELAPYGGCHICFMPQAWCNRWREKSGAGKAGMFEWVKEEKQCDHQDVVMETLAVLHGLEPGFAQQMQERMPKGIGWEEVTGYLGERVRWGEVDMFRMVVELSEGLEIEG